MAQAERLADGPFWGRIAALYSSPEQKALSTVRPAAVRHGLEVVADARLREVARPAVWIEEYEAAVETYLEADGTPEGWEPRGDVRARMTECVGEITARHRGDPVAVSGHGLALSLYLSTLDNAPGTSFTVWRAIGFGQVAVVEDGRLVAPFLDPLDLNL